jgi:hypothetical protein
MNKGILKLLLVGLASKLLSGAQTSHYRDLVRMRFSLFYLKLIKTTRLLCLSFLGIGVCLIFLLMGMISLEIVIFVYCPGSVESKLNIGLLLALICFLISLSAFSFAFSESKWIDMFHVDKISGKKEE